MKNLLNQIEQDQERVVLVAPTHEIPEHRLIAQKLVINPRRGYLADSLPRTSPQAINLHLRASAITRRERKPETEEFREETAGSGKVSPVVGR